MFKKIRKIIGTILKAMRFACATADAIETNLAKPAQAKAPAEAGTATTEYGTVNPGNLTVRITIGTGSDRVEITSDGPCRDIGVTVEHR